ncbi:hypothetical protein J6590_103314 [Homalodisca vitripennis]|nr:hypothetical protein J6590_103314 [Homalodisca vitripennis]
MAGSHMADVTIKRGEVTTKPCMVFAYNKAMTGIDNCDHVTPDPGGLSDGKSAPEPDRRRKHIEVIIALKKELTPTRIW